MIYFIPAWYNARRTWYFNSRPWSEQQELVRYDDISNHFARFSDAGEACQLIVNNYTPQLRYFMHRLELLEKNFISTFDLIQDINSTNKEQTPLDFHLYDWPDEVEFVYTPFSILANNNGELYAQIEFGDFGQLFWITVFKAGVPVRRHIFDDRGFESSRIIYDEEGLYHYQDYLNESGEWQIREYFEHYGRHVEVNETAQHRFSKARYESIGEVVFEFLQTILSQHDTSDDVIFLAEDERHTLEILEMKSNKKVIHSFFQGRNSSDLSLSILKALRKVDLVLTTLESHRNILQPFSPAPVRRIPLVDTRLNLGKSRQMKEKIIYVRLDGLRAERFPETFNTIVRYMETNKFVYLHIVSFETDAHKKEAVRKQLTEIFNKYNEQFQLLEESTQTVENSIFETSKSRVNLSFLTIADDIIKHINDARVVIDGATDTDLYTHIAAISAGIPQINRVSSEYVEHKKNGYIAPTVEELYNGLDYYLTQTIHWNEALIDTIRKTEQYSNDKIIEQIKNVIY